MEKEFTRIDNQCVARAVDVDKRTVRFLAQSTAMASDNLLILAFAGKKHNKTYMENPIVTPYHMRQSFEGGPIVIGSVVATEFSEKGMHQTVEFADNELGEQYWILYRDRHMRAVSIAWDREDEREVDPKKMLKLLEKENLKIKPADAMELRGIVKHYKQRDLSLVAIGADPKALARSADGGNEAAADMIKFYREDGGSLYLPKTIPPVDPGHSNDPPPPDKSNTSIDVMRGVIKEEIGEAFKEYFGPKDENDIDTEEIDNNDLLHDGSDINNAADASGDKPKKKSKFARLYDGLPKFDRKEIKRKPKPDFSKVLDGMKKENKNKKENE